jgi:glycosyltransferase involved in cell wall biosynthesis
VSRPEITAVDITAEVTVPVPVAFVSPSAEMGGGEQYLISLLEQLGPTWASGLTLLSDGPARERFEALDVPLEMVPTGTRVGVLPAARRLRRVLERQRPSVVHANGVKAALVAVLAARPLDLPVIWVKHDFSWDGALARWIGDRCRMVVGVSKSVTEVFAGRDVDVRVVLNGLPTYSVDRESARGRLLQAIGLGDETEAVLCVGRLETGKGQLHLVEELPRLRRVREHAHLALAGPPSRFEPSYEGQVRARARELGVEHAVSFLGHRQDAIELMGGADVVAVPTLPYTRPGTGEGFGLVAAEAMAVGTPVVAYRHGGLPEVLGDAGILIEPHDAAGLADAIAGLLADPERREQLAAAGRDRVGEFELAGVAAAMRRLYREAAGIPVVSLSEPPAAG